VAYPKRALAELARIPSQKPEMAATLVSAARAVTAGGKLIPQRQIRWSDQAGICTSSIRSASWSGGRDCTSSTGPSSLSLLSPTRGFLYRMRQLRWLRSLRLSQTLFVVTVKPERERVSGSVEPDSAGDTFYIEVSPQTASFPVQEPVS
jgi:hypothetical protein